MIENKEILNQLLSLCQACETGTLFITTAENRACHVVIDNGRITALSCGRLRGAEVVEQLPVLAIERFSFKPQVKMPLAGRSFVDEDYDVLAELGLSSAANEPVHSETAEQSGVTLIYRGQVIQKSQPAEKTPSQDGFKKPARMYRGQLLED